jgi:hypothetical protein
LAQWIEAFLIIVNIYVNHGIMNTLTSGTVSKLAFATKFEAVYLYCVHHNIAKS